MPTILLVGGGKMGGALLGGWLDRGMAPGEVCVVEPNIQACQDFARLGVHAASDPDSLPSGSIPEVVILAVKPQVMDTVLPPYRSLVGPATVFLSIAAGKTLAYFQNILGSEAAIVRAMPNTPAAARRGVSVLCANSRVDERRKAICADLLSAVGEVSWISDETLMDAVTAVSGSGPAYVFLLAETLAQAGIEAGLPEALAHQLARATVSGSGELLRQSSDSPAQLRQNVTSPGGTTAEALHVLMGPDGLQSLMSRAIAAAARRSRELAQP